MNGSDVTDDYKYGRYLNINPDIGVPIRSPPPENLSPQTNNTC